MREVFGNIALYVLVFSVQYLWVALALTRVKPVLRRHAPKLCNGAIYVCAVALVLSDLDRGWIGFFLGQLVVQADILNQGITTAQQGVAKT